MNREIDSLAKRIEDYFYLFKDYTMFDFDITDERRSASFEQRKIDLLDIEAVDEIIFNVKDCNKNLDNSYNNEAQALIKLLQEQRMLLVKKEEHGMNRETNAGYEITEKLTIGNSVFVLGNNDTRFGTKYVTWQARADDPANYFWGHYLDNYEDAREDLFERAHSESQSLNPNYHKRQSEKLPAFCMSTRPSDGCLIKITHKESGYKIADISTEDSAENKYVAKYINELMGVAPAQEAAMIAGSMFGWNTPAANPVNYDENGKAIRPKNKSDRDSR